MGEIDLEQRLACIEDAVRMLNLTRIALEGRCFALEKVLTGVIGTFVPQSQQYTVLRDCIERAYVEGLNSLESDHKVEAIEQGFQRLGFPILSAPAMSKVEVSRWL